MNDTAHVLLDLFVMFAGAKLAGELFQRLRQPPVIGEILAGTVLSAIGLISHSPVNEALAEIGAIVLLFYVGLETRASSIFAVGRSAFLVAVLGIIFPFILGYTFMTVLGSGSAEAMFVGTAMIATSVGITARVMSDMGLLRSVEARIILGAAVIDDVLAMLGLAVVSGLGAGDLSLPSLAITAIEAVAFTI